MRMITATAFAISSLLTGCVSAPMSMRELQGAGPARASFEVAQNYETLYRQLSANADECFKIGHALSVSLPQAQLFPAAKSAEIRVMFMDRVHEALTIEATGPDRSLLRWYSVFDKDIAHRLALVRGWAVEGATGCKVAS